MGTGPTEARDALNSRKPLVLIAAAVIAIISVFVIYSYVKGQKNKAFGNAKMIKVWVVRNQVPKGTYGQQTGGLIARDEIPKAFYPSNAITDLAQIQNKVAVANLAANSIVVQDNFVDPSVASVSLSTQLKKIRNQDQVALSINVNDIQGVAGLIVPGDFVNVMVTNVSGSDLSAGGGEAAGAGAATGGGQSCAGIALPAGANAGDFLFCQQARPILQKVEVLAIGKNAIPQPGQEASAASATSAPANTGLITFIVPMEFAQMIASVPPGHFYLALVSKDYKPIPTKVIAPDAPLPSEDPKVLTPYGPSGPT